MYGESLKKVLYYKNKQWKWNSIWCRLSLWNGDL